MQNFKGAFYYKLLTYCTSLISFLVKALPKNKVGNG